MYKLTFSAIYVIIFDEIKHDSGYKSSRLDTSHHRLFKNGLNKRSVHLTAIESEKITLFWFVFSLCDLETHTAFLALANNRKKTNITV